MDRRKALAAAAAAAAAISAAAAVVVVAGRGGAAEVEKDGDNPTTVVGWAGLGCGRPRWRSPSAQNWAGFSTLVN
jgi:hypothetical protein